MGNASSRIRRTTKRWRGCSTTPAGTLASREGLPISFWPGTNAEENGGWEPTDLWETIQKEEKSGLIRELMAEGSAHAGREGGERGFATARE
jgi:hypothetical protein